MNLCDRTIGTGQPCFVIAEAGVNHNGSLDLAHRLVDAAKTAGADAVKFQTFRTDALVTAQAARAIYQQVNTGRSDPQWAMLKALELTDAGHIELQAHCRQAGMVFLSTPYDRNSLALLDRLNVPAIKIASTDTTNTPFLRDADRIGRPVILSTGMCDMAEVAAAVAALDSARRDGRLCLLQCTSEYPAAPEELNLRAMATLAATFGTPVGFSDHSEGVDAALWATAAGAAVIEKHFTLDRSLPGPDHRASLDPDGLTAMVEGIRRVERALGDGVKRAMPSESMNRGPMRKSVVAARDLPTGTRLDEGDLACKRPGDGLPPIWLERLIGRPVRRSVPVDAMLQVDDVDWEA